MSWVEGISQAIRFIEANITEELAIDEIARQAYVSPFYFQKGFTMLCGLSVGEYIRQRRLTLAGSELVATDMKVIDIALKYGYDSPDSFTRAFFRFHGVTPTAVRKDGAMIRSLAPLSIKLVLKGGYTMDYKIVEKASFTIVGVSRRFKMDTALSDLPQFWTEHFQSDMSRFICGMYGVCIDEDAEALADQAFDYLIADIYDPTKDVPDGVVTRVIPAHTWAVFACHGPMPKALQDVNHQIFSEWLPGCRDYEIAAGYNIEMYSNVDDYPNGNQDSRYYSEIWIPVKRKR